jgi:hypothetical protein
MKRDMIDSYVTSLHQEGILIFTTYLFLKPYSLLSFTEKLTRVNNIIESIIDPTIFYKQNIIILIYYMFTTYLASYNQVFHLNFPLFFYT